MTIPVQVRHSGKKYAVELDIEQPGLVFKQQLQVLTNVLPERQKILVKGGQLADDADLSKLGVKPQQSFMMLGTAGELPKAPVPNAAAAAAETEAAEEDGDPVPAGLDNLGNTCYANATLQAMNAAPELRNAVAAYRGDNKLVRMLGGVFNELQKQTESVTPAQFLMALRQSFPQFAETGRGGMPKQQDAEELWTQLFTALKSAHVGEAEHLFDGQFATTLKCTETEEPATDAFDEFTKLNCHISISTNFLRDGLLAGLTEDIEKHNDSLGRNANYTLTKRISRLPQYLTIQFVRFFWRRDTRKKSKILRKVAFPMMLDVGDLCTDELRAKLVPARDEYRQLEDAEEEARRAVRRVTGRAGHTTAEAKKKAHDEVLSSERRQQLHDNIVAKIDPTIAEDKGTNPLGLYELAAVVTHQGMSADSGHYQCFVRNDQEAGMWYRFNDDTVTVVEEARIEQLAGGGESDSALILLYRTVKF